MKKTSISSYESTSSRERESTSQSAESAPVREGKTYAYQSTQEAMAVNSPVGEQKRKVVDAFAAFIDALATGAPTRPACDDSTGANPGQKVPGGYAGSSTNTGTAATPTGTGKAPGNPSAGTGGQRPNTGPGGERASETAGTMAAKEAMEVSILSQREAYQLDRVRESTRRKSRESSSAPSTHPGAGAGDGLLLDGRNKHRSDSNRAPLTESKVFSPSFGPGGKTPVSTIERVSVLPSKRPETVPAPGVVGGMKPIDAYWGSFGTAIERAAVRAKVDYMVMESILGTDDRIRVTNYKLYPWRCICSLLITAGTGAQYLGTGWLVAPRLLLTAGHCVYMSDEGGWVSQIEVIPGRDADSRPFGSAIAREFRSVEGWTQDGDSNCDYGCILLPTDQRLGDQLGWFGYASREDDYLKNITLNLAGYPGDGGPAHVDGTQWYDFRTVKEVLAKQLTYEIDTYGGQSGAPVWEMQSDGNRYGVAIHTFGTAVNNGGTRITSEVFDNIVRWAGQAP